MLVLVHRLAVLVKRRVQGLVLRATAHSEAGARGVDQWGGAGTWMFQKCAPTQLAYEPSCSVTISRLCRGEGCVSVVGGQVERPAAAAAHILARRPLLGRPGYASQRAPKKNRGSP